MNYFYDTRSGYVFERSDNEVNYLGIVGGKRRRIAVDSVPADAVGIGESEEIAWRFAEGSGCLDGLTRERNDD